MMGRAGANSAAFPHAHLLSPLRRAYAMAMPLAKQGASTSLSSRRDWTVAEINALPDNDNRYEVVDGELLVTPSPSYAHQDAILALVMRMGTYVESRGLHLLFAPAAVTFSPRREVQPDLLVLPTRSGVKARRFADAGRLELAVEVLSPSSSRADRYVKRRLYQSEGVPEYWMIDIGNRCVERWRPADEEPEVLVDALAWQPHADAAALVIDLVDFFRAVHGT